MMEPPREVLEAEIVRLKECVADSERAYKELDEQNRKLNLTAGAQVSWLRQELRYASDKIIELLASGGTL